MQLRPPVRAATANNPRDDLPPPYLANPPLYPALRPAERERRKRVAYEGFWRRVEGICITLHLILLVVLAVDRYLLHMASEKIREDDARPWVMFAWCSMAVTSLSTVVVFFVGGCLSKRPNNGIRNMFFFSPDAILLVAWTYIFVVMMVAFCMLDFSDVPVTWALGGMACVLLQVVYAGKVVTRVPCVFEEKFGTMVDLQVQRAGV